LSIIHHTSRQFSIAHCVLQINAGFEPALHNNKQQEVNRMKDLAIEKIKKELALIKGDRYVGVVKKPKAEALIEFCQQDSEFLCRMPPRLIKKH